MTRVERQQIAAPPRLHENLFPLTSETAAQEIFTDALSCLGPFLKSAGSQHGRSTARTQRTAKSCSSFAIHLLRAAMAQVTDQQPSGLRDTIVQLASLSLEALSMLRESLRGKPYEVEMQRYLLLRKLVALRSYSNAIHQAWVLYMALCCQCWQPLSALPLSDCTAASIHPLPMADTCSNSEIASLIVGTVLNLLLSIIEHGDIQSGMNKVMTIVQDYGAIMSWLRYSCTRSLKACLQLQAITLPMSTQMRALLVPCRLLPEAEQATHADTLFRYLFKVLFDVSAMECAALPQQMLVSPP